MCNCQVLKRTFYDFCTLLVFRSTAVVLCNYNENIYMCSYYNMNTYIFAHVRVQIYLTCCVYAGSFMEFQCFEVKPEDDSKEITECSYDDKPSTGMFSVS